VRDEAGDDEQVHLADRPEGEDHGTAREAPLDDDQGLPEVEPEPEAAPDRDQSGAHTSERPDHRSEDRAFESGAGGDEGDHAPEHERGLEEVEDGVGDRPPLEAGDVRDQVPERVRPAERDTQQDQGAVVAVAEQPLRDQ
jgi:hypothetical protein